MLNAKQLGYFHLSAGLVNGTGGFLLGLKPLFIKIA
jgi:hypothetical protein